MLHPRRTPHRPAGKEARCLAVFRLPHKLALVLFLRERTVSAVSVGEVVGSSLGAGLALGSGEGSPAGSSLGAGEGSSETFVSTTGVGSGVVSGPSAKTAAGIMLAHSAREHTNAATRRKPLLPVRISKIPPLKLASVLSVRPASRTFLLWGSGRPRPLRTSPPFLLPPAAAGCKCCGSAAPCRRAAGPACCATGRAGSGGCPFLRARLRCGRVPGCCGTGGNGSRPARCG